MGKNKINSGVLHPLKKRVVLSVTALSVLLNMGLTPAQAQLLENKLSGKVSRSGTQEINDKNTNLGAQGSQPWDYNPGPDPRTAEGRRFIDLYSNMPEYSLMSDILMDDQKFRSTYGTMLTRTRFERNAVKIFFIGQDATHIAEASKQPGTSGFGGRVQAIANYFGVDQSVATTNAYSSTIKGQYGSKGHPYIELDTKGVPQVKYTTYVDNGFWALSNDPDSKIRQDREAFFEYMIEHNPESLKMMVLFGGAAKDAFAEFLRSRGAEVPTRMSADRLQNISVPETRIVSAGGNNTFPALVTKDGKDLYQVLLEDHPKYSSFLDKRGNLDYSLINEKLNRQKTNKERVKLGQDLKKSLESVLVTKKDIALKLMAFTGGGIGDSGVMNPAQLGGYDLSKVKINGVETNSLKGLKLKNGYVIKDDLLFAESAHPTALTMLAQEKGAAAAEDALMKSFEPLKKWQEKGWSIQPDMGRDGKIMENSFALDKRPNWGRGEVTESYFEFGAPSDRRANSASATRDGSQVILAGATDKKFFDKEAIEKAKLGIPSEILNPNDLATVRQRAQDTRYTFDRGPGKERAKLLYTAIDQSKLFKLKPGYQVVLDKEGNDVSFGKYGIDAYYSKTDINTGLFGFHRGSFETSEALILADPHGMDDWNTSRALTGARGQYLNRMMDDLGIGEKYLVIKTVPVGMDGATAEEWEYVRKNTEKYREVAIREALKSGKVKYLFADGEIAAQELRRIMDKTGKVYPIVNIRRDGMDPRSGIIEAREMAQRAFRVAEGKKFNEPLQMKDIPRSHLTWWSRLWEGTGGDHVIEAIGKERGRSRALVAPNWVPRQNIRALEGTQASIRKIQEKFDSLNLRKGKVKISVFLEKLNLKGSLADKLAKRAGLAETSENVRSLIPAAQSASGNACERVFKKAQ